METTETRALRRIPGKLLLDRGRNKVIQEELVKENIVE